MLFSLLKFDFKNLLLGYLEFIGIVSAIFFFKSCENFCLILAENGRNLPNSIENRSKYEIFEELDMQFFRHVHAFKRLSALISPSGKEQIVPIPIYRCDECGHINDEFLPKDA